MISLANCQAMCRDINGVGRCKKPEETGYKNVPRRACIFRCATPPLGLWEGFLLFRCKTRFLSPFTQNRTFLSKCLQPPKPPPCLTFHNQPVLPQFYTLRREGVPAPPRTAFRPLQMIIILGFFSPHEQQHLQYMGRDSEHSSPSESHSRPGSWSGSAPSSLLDEFGAKLGFGVPSHN